VTASVFDGSHDDAAILVVRRDTGAGYERVDYLDAQGGTGDVLRGFTIRNDATQTEWSVAVDRNGNVTGCGMRPIAHSELQRCIATDATFTGTLA
jgi:hypothetical protein